MTYLEKKLERLQNYHVEVREFEDEIIFLRSIIKGNADKSYGIHVAKMAGVPKEVIDRATKILDGEIFNTKKQNKINLNKKIKLKEQEFINELRDIDINAVTPLEALAKLNELKNKIKS